jgi:hypothetical protein
LAPFDISNTIYFDHKTSHLNEEVNCAALKITLAVLSFLLELAFPDAINLFFFARIIRQ